MSNQPLPDTLALMKSSKNFFQLDEKSNGDVFWNGMFIHPLWEIGTIIKTEEYDITPNFQKDFTSTKLTTETLKIAEKETVYDDT